MQTVRAAIQGARFDSPLYPQRDGPRLERGEALPEMARCGNCRHRNARGSAAIVPKRSRGAHSRESAHRRAAHQRNRSARAPRRDRLHDGRGRNHRRSRPRHAGCITASRRMMWWTRRRRCRLREASRLIEAGLVNFGEVLERRAREFQHTPQIGRTHGIHAEPITFGLKIANWFAENRRNHGALPRTPRNKWPWAKFPEPWAIARIWAPRSKKKFARGSGWTPTPVTSQVIQRDRHAQYVSTLAIIAATLEKIALEIRHLQRTEVREAEEPFGGEQRGSSAMPHKRNPVSSEQVCGLARVVRANAWRPWKISRCGTSATSRTAPSNASSCRTRRFWWTTCWRA